MYNWIILSKLILVINIALIYVDKYAKAFSENVWANIIFVLFTLIYISIDVLSYIFRKAMQRKIIKFVVLIFLLIGYFEINDLFILLIPMVFYELIGDVVNPYIIVIGTIFSVFAVKPVVTYYYVFAAGLSCVIYFLNAKSYTRINNIIRENDVLREKNQRLRNNLNSREEYIQQIKYVSQIEERNKIAQEIHDKLGHSISGSLMQLEAAKIIMNSDGEKSKNLIQNTIDVLRQGMESIRATLKNIKPSLQQRGISRVKLIANEFSETSGIEASVIYCAELDDTSIIVWDIIYDNIKEVLTNVMKYSKASKVKITMENINKYIKVEIKDNGIGCLKIKKGMGITGIEERTGRLGGKVIVDGSDGFSVIILIPKNYK